MAREEVPCERCWLALRLYSTRLRMSAPLVAMHTMTRDRVVPSVARLDGRWRPSLRVHRRLKSVPTRR